MNEALKRAQANYNKKCKVYVIRVNRETEPEVVEWLERGKIAPRLKALIKKDIKEHPLE